MNYVLELKKRTEKLDKALKDFTGTNETTFWLSDRIDCLVRIIQQLCDDTENDWIGYWLWELDNGKRAEKNTVVYNDKNIPIKTLNDLYNLLNNEQRDTI